MSAREMFYPGEKNFSVAEEKAFAREELVYNTTEDILVLLEDLDITKNELARRLGKSRSYVTQLLSGARNMTLGSLSDICFALDAKPEIVIKYQTDSNQVCKKPWHEETPTLRAKRARVSSQKIIYFDDAMKYWGKQAA